jgi:hypothetical protein
MKSKSSIAVLEQKVDNLISYIETFQGKGSIICIDLVSVELQVGNTFSVFFKGEDVLNKYVNAVNTYFSDVNNPSLLFMDIESEHTNMFLVHNYNNDNINSNSENNNRYLSIYTEDIVLDHNFHKKVENKEIELEKWYSMLKNCYQDTKSVLFFREKMSMSVGSGTVSFVAAIWIISAANFVEDKNNIIYEKLRGFLLDHSIHSIIPKLQQGFQEITLEKNKIQNEKDAFERYQQLILANRHSYYNIADSNENKNALDFMEMAKSAFDNIEISSANPEFQKGLTLLNRAIEKSNNVRKLSSLRDAVLYSVFNPDYDEHKHPLIKLKKNSIVQIIRFLEENYVYTETALQPIIKYENKQEHPLILDSSQLIATFNVLFNLWLNAKRKYPRFGAKFFEVTVKDGEKNEIIVIFRNKGVLSDIHLKAINELNRDYLEGRGQGLKLIIDEIKWLSNWKIKAENKPEDFVEIQVTIQNETEKI